MTSRLFKLGILCSALLLLGAGAASAGDGRDGRRGRGDAGYHEDRGRHHERHDRWSRHDGHTRRGYPRHIEKHVYHHRAPGYGAYHYPPSYAPPPRQHHGHRDQGLSRLAPRVTWLGPLPILLPPPPHVVFGFHRR
jgi:hypothetical protein